VVLKVVKMIFICGIFKQMLTTAQDLDGGGPGT